MASEIAGSHTNGTMEDVGSANRSIKDHMLFEISTEVANRGKTRCVNALYDAEYLWYNQSVAFTRSSNLKLLSLQQNTEIGIHS